MKRLTAPPAAVRRRYFVRAEFSTTQRYYGVISWRLRDPSDYCRVFRERALL